MYGIYKRAIIMEVLIFRNLLVPSKETPKSPRNAKAQCFFGTWNGQEIINETIP